MYDYLGIERKYGATGLKLIKRIPSDWLRSNAGLIWDCLDSCEPQIVEEIIDNYNLLVSYGSFDRLRDYCFLWTDLKQLKDQDSEKVKYKFKFFGQVQNVGFRATTRSYMKILEIHGDAENLPNGSVEVHAEGSESRIAVFKIALNKKFKVTKTEETKI